MFRHKGNRRTHIHNLRLASILSFIAGVVNICGVLSINILTTNVTGHFAYFSDQIVNNNYSSAFSFLLFIFFFLFGAFSSNVLIEIVSRIRPRISHTLPMIIEMLILSFIGFFGYTNRQLTLDVKEIACGLLFAMGLQNSLVTQISQSTVRTTHLTGLFTDLGIELSQLIFYRRSSQIQKLSNSIYLRLIIIACFFLGGILGGFLFGFYKLQTLLLAALLLIIAMLYDSIRYRFYVYKRKITSANFNT